MNAIYTNITVNTYNVCRDGIILKVVAALKNAGASHTHILNFKNETKVAGRDKVEKIASKYVSIN